MTEGLIQVKLIRDLLKHIFPRVKTLCSTSQLEQTKQGALNMSIAQPSAQSCPQRQAQLEGSATAQSPKAWGSANLPAEPLPSLSDAVLSGCRTPATIYSCERLYHQQQKQSLITAITRASWEQNLSALSPASSHAFDHWYHHSILMHSDCCLKIRLGKKKTSVEPPEL